MRYDYHPPYLELDLSAHLGHLSIVNTTLIHPVLPVIATAGIERHVILHSPTPNTSWATDLLPTRTNTRPLPSGGPAPSDPSILRLLMRLSTIMEVDESMGEDARSIAYFDLWVSFFSFFFLDSFSSFITISVLMRVDVCVQDSAT